MWLGGGERQFKRLGEVFGREQRDIVVELSEDSRWRQRAHPGVNLQRPPDRFAICAGLAPFDRVADASAVPQ